MNKEEWDKMSNEELCIEYQKEPSNELFEYFCCIFRRSALYSLRLYDKYRIYSEF